MRHTFVDKTGTPLLIRPAVEDDAEAVIEYIQRVDAESPFLSREPGEFDMPVATERLFLRRIAEQENSLFLVAFDGERLVSTLDFHGGRGSRTCHTGEFGMSVAMSHWGRGLGAHMLDTLLAWAEQTGILSRVKLRVNASNDRAIALYRSRGFIEEGRLRRELFVAGEWVDVLCMARWLGPEPR